MYEPDKVPQQDIDRLAKAEADYAKQQIEALQAYIERERDIGKAYEERIKKP